MADRPSKPIDVWQEAALRYERGAKRDGYNIERTTDAAGCMYRAGRALLAAYQLQAESLEEHRQRIAHLETEVGELRRIRRPDETSAPQAPIARMMVADGFVTWTHLKAPGLPDGMHNVFCEPEVIAPCLGMRHTLQEIRDHSTDTWARGLARESVGPRLCPHGMPANENVCGPCSRGEPNRHPGSPQEPPVVHMGVDDQPHTGRRADCAVCALKKVKEDVSALDQSSPPIDWSEKASGNHEHEWRQLPRGINFCVTCGATEDT